MIAGARMRSGHKLGSPRGIPSCRQGTRVSCVEYGGSFTDCTTLQNSSPVTDQPVHVAGGLA